MRMLDRPRPGDNGIKLIVFTLKCHIATLAQAFHDLNTLVGHPTTRGKWPCIQGGKLLRTPAHASPQNRTST